MNLNRFIYPLFLLSLIISGFWFIGSALTGILLLIAVVMGCRSISTRNAWHSFTLSKLMVIYLVWLFIVALSSAVPHTVMLITAVLAGLPVMYLVASNTSTFAETWGKLRIALFLMGVSFSVWAIWQVVNHIGYGHAVGPLIDRNAFAALMNLLWFPAVYLFLSNKSNAYPWVQVFIGIGLFIISTAFFATASRGGIATWLLLLPFILWAGYKYTKSIKLISIIGFIAIFAFFSSAMLLDSSITDRTFQLAQDASTNARLLLWQSSIKMAFEHPFLGTGWGTFASYYPAHRSPLENSSSGLLAHNDYLQFATEGGIFALLLQVALLLGLLLQLKRSLVRATEAAGLESVALLLGVLALFIHASVSFIFYFAFMNILAGLYLARAAQLIDKPRTINIRIFEQIRPLIKHLIASFVVLLIATPLCLNLIALACLTGSQFGLKVINLMVPNVRAYSIANLISIIRPSEGISQLYILSVDEMFLADRPRLSQLGGAVEREFLMQSLQRFDSARAQMGNNPNLGVREVKLLMVHHVVYDSKATIGHAAYVRAHEILNENLKANPFHVNSMIMLARLQVAEGFQVEALSTLRYASTHVLGHLEQQLIKVEALRQLAAPKVIAELDDIENQLYLIGSVSAAGKPLIFPDNIGERLHVIADKIEQGQ
ncbi:MAG TPA: O-antigen ligase family protein [Methylotenera sp.]|nr:O-antigen ligase family protein [Methylotenera sp.]